VYYYVHNSEGSQLFAVVRASNGFGLGAALRLVADGHQRFDAIEELVEVTKAVRALRWLQHPQFSWTTEVQRGMLKKIERVTSAQFSL